MCYWLRVKDMLLTCLKYADTGLLVKVTLLAVLGSG